MISEYNRCFDSTPVKDAIIKQELIADTVKTLNRQSLEDAIRAFLDISSPVGILVKYLESPWYRYLTFEINKNTGVMELQESQKSVRLSEIDRSAAQKVTNAGDWEKMLRALIDSCLLYNLDCSTAVSGQKSRIPADELDSRLRWDAKRADAGLQAVWATPDKLPVYTASAILTQPPPYCNGKTLPISCQFSANFLPWAKKQSNFDLRMTRRISCTKWRFKHTAPFHVRCAFRAFIKMPQH